MNANETTHQSQMSQCVKLKLLYFKVWSSTRRNKEHL